MLTIIIVLAVLYFGGGIAGIIYESRPAARQHDIAYQKREMEREAMRLASKQN